MSRGDWNKIPNMRILTEYLDDLNDYYDGRITITYKKDYTKKVLIIWFSRDDKRVRVEHTFDMIRSLKYVENLVDTDLKLIRQGGYLW